METDDVKNYVIGGLICLVAALAIGVEPVQRYFNETMNRGKLRGVENCFDYSGSDLISSDAIRATCVETFQRPLYSGDYATGRAGPRLVEEETVGWGGTLENKTPDHVITWVEIKVSIIDAEGKEQEFSAGTQIWIDPLGEATFSVELPEIEREQVDDREFCDYNDPQAADCLGWSVSKIMGLSI